MKKQKIIIIAEVAVFAAIAFILDLLATLYSGFFVNGGSISLALIPIVILSFRRGPIAGVICGLIVGLLDLTDGFYTATDTWYGNFMQIGLDYIFTYMLAAIVGVFKPLIKKIDYKLILVISVVVAGILKFTSHFLSGVIFWPQFEGQPFLERVVYSVLYNGSYMLPTTIICGLVMYLISLKFKKLILLES